MGKFNLRALILFTLICLILFQSYPVINVFPFYVANSKTHGYEFVKFPNSSQSTVQDVNSSVLCSEDVNNNKIVDSLEKEIEGNSSQEMRILIQYRHTQVLHATLSSNNIDIFVQELSREFPDVKIEFVYTLIDAVVVTARGKVIPSIAMLPNIERIEPDVQVQTTLDTAVPVIGADKVWAHYGYHGENQTIAILDTGIWPEHPDFNGKIVGWKDFMNMQPDPYDDNGHGTMVASIAAGTGDGSNGTYKGVAYMANIAAVKVLNNYGRGYFSWVILGLEWVVANKDVYNITVVNLSFGSRGPSDGKDALGLACNRVVDEGIVVVVAAGNFGPEPFTVGSPAAAEKVITVGAVDRSTKIASWSSRGPTLDDRYKPDICAVGVSVTAASLPYLKYPELEWKIYRSVSGTSVAAPMITGATALLKQAHPEWAPDKVKAALLTRAFSREGGANNDYGYGIADIFEALKGPAPTLSIYTWKFVSEEPAFAEAKAYGQRCPNPYVLVNGTWFTSNSLVDIRWDNTTVLAADVPINENANFAINVTAPRSAWGIHYISAWNITGFITQNMYEILRPTLIFSASELFQTTVDFARPGVTIWAKGRYYDPNGTIMIKWDNTTILADNAPTDTEGIFLASMIIPLSATVGLHYISTWNGTEFATQKEFHVIEATPVSGIISGNTTWTRYGSPYILTGNLLIYENVTFVIESGVEVIATGDYYIWIYRGATFNATGTQDNPIIFRSNVTGYPAWGGIRTHRFAQNISVYLRHVIISRARYGFGAFIEGHYADVSGAIIRIVNCTIFRCNLGIYMDTWGGSFSLYLSCCQITENLEGAIRFSGVGGPMFADIQICNNIIASNLGSAISTGYHSLFNIYNNTIISNHGDAIVVSNLGISGDGHIHNNIIAYNSGAGISAYLHSWAHITISQNYIARNSYGIRMSTTGSSLNEVHINGNDIYGDVEYDFLAGQTTPYGPEKYNATYNYWGTISAKKISEQIYDFYDDFSLAEVIYIPYLNSSTRACVLGWLMDFTTGLPIENASITGIGPSFIYTCSNASGYFALEGLLPGEYTITVSREGYETLSWFECVGEAQTFETEVCMSDKTPPEIGSAVQEPAENVAPHQDVTISVNVTDLGSGVYNVTLWYSVNNGTTWSYSNMTKILANLYQATIPGCENNTWVTYKIIAYDNSGNHVINDNRGHYYVYYVIPEFTSVPIIPLLMIATLLAVIIHRRKHFMQQR